MTTLQEIGTRIADGGSLRPADVEVLLRSSDLLGLGAVADEVRRRRHADRTTFARVQEIPIAAVGQAGVEVVRDAGEVRLTGRPAGGREALDVVAQVAEAAGRIPVTGFAVEVLAEIAAGDAHALRDLASELKAAGLALVAEAQAERLPGPDSLEAVRRGGLRVARLTIGETDEDGGLALIRRVADWGEAAAHAHAFAPLPRVLRAQPTTGYRDLRQVALARLLADNIDSIQVDWSLYGPKLAQVALLFGADDVDSVPPVDGQDRGPRRTPLEEITRNIRASALMPVERDGCFEGLER